MKKDLVLSWSKKTQKENDSQQPMQAEQKYAPTELELAALIFGLVHFQVYLLGNRVTVYGPPIFSFIIPTLLEEPIKMVIS